MLAVAGHLQAGQVGVFLMLIVLLDLTGDPRQWWHGIGVGIAAGIKLTPLIFIAYLVMIGRIRAAVTATAAFARHDRDRIRSGGRRTRGGTSAAGCSKRPG